MFTVKGERSQCECAEMGGCSLTHKVDDIVYVSLTRVELKHIDMCGIINY